MNYLYIENSSANSSMEVLKLKAVSKVYTLGEEKVKAIDGMNVSIKKGNFVAIVGPSLAYKVGSFSKNADFTIHIQIEPPCSPLRLSLCFCSGYHRRYSTCMVSFGVETH